MKRNLKNLFRKLLTTATLLAISFNLAFGQLYTLNQTLSSGAQQNTIAFDGLAFVTGNFCACSFIPPGKVADYFGFQYQRDNDITHMGHNTDFLTVLANNLLYVLNSTQKAQLISLAQAQAGMISQYAYQRFPLINAFIRMRDNTMPNGCTSLSKEAMKCYSGQLYRLDGRISYQRAKLYASIINSLTAQKKHYLDSISVLGMANMPHLPDQVNKTLYPNEVFVAVMSYASDIYAWYVGNLQSDVYFCPERQGNYFGGFYIKDAPAMGNAGYSIDTNLTQNGGVNFLAALTPAQALQITKLVTIQASALDSLVTKRTEISTLLRTYLNGNNVDTNLVLSLSQTYGELDAEISYYYATHFSQVNWTLSAAQHNTLNILRNLSNYPCTGAYVYSNPIPAPSIMNTDFLFQNAVLSNTAVGVSITASTTASVCQGSVVTYTASPVNGGTAPVYQWKVNGNNAGTNSPTFTYAPANGDQVRCVLTSSQSCVTMTNNPASSNLITASVTASLPISVSISANPSNNVNAGSPLVLTAVPVNGGTTPAYQWNINNLNTGPNSATFTYTPSANFLVRCTLTSNHACVTGNPAQSNILTITVKPSCQLPPPAMPGPITGPTTVSPNTTAFYNIAPVPNAGTYTWLAPPNATISSGQGTGNIQLSFGPAWAGGNLSVKASNCAGISGNSLVKLMKTVIKSVSAAPGKGASEGDDKLLILPNPADDRFSISYSAEDESTVIVRITDMSGRQVYAKTFSQVSGENLFEIPVADLARDVYMVSLEKEGKLTRHARVIAGR